MTISPCTVGIYIYIPTVQGKMVILLVIYFVYKMKLFTAYQTAYKGAYAIPFSIAKQNGCLLVDSGLKTLLR